MRGAHGGYNKLGLTAVAGLLACALAGAQTPLASASQEQWQKLQQAVAAAQRQLQQDQAALAALQSQVQQLAGQLAAVRDQQNVTAGEVQTQEQTKVASGSRFRVTLSGLLLMNAYDNQGAVEDSDVPNLALPGGSSSGDIGASMRQSEISLRVLGPQLWGAQASGELIADFFGGLPNSLDGSASGLARLKIARGRLDWQNTSLLFGEDTPLISPLSPTSYASVAVPALGYSGNLWTWTPQFALEHRWNLDTNWKAELQAGVMDPLSGEFPARTNSRQPEAGERSRQPALELHAGAGRERYEREMEGGVGAYTSQQDYGFGRKVRAWALTADWQAPLTPWLDLSGEAFRGRALGGLWGGIGTSIVASAPDLTSPAVQVAGLNAAGGWAQLKWLAAPTLQFNAAYGLDHPFAGDLARFAAVNPRSPLAENRTALVNVIERPRSDLILALEYRRLLTSRWLQANTKAAQINAALGIMF